MVLGSLRGHPRANSRIEHRKAHGARGRLSLTSLIQKYDFPSPISRICISKSLTKKSYFRILSGFQGYALVRRAFATGIRIEHQKIQKKMKKVEKTSNVAIDSGHVRVGFVIERPRSLPAPRPCCWPRFWPRSSQCGHLLATLRPRSTWPEHGPQHGRALWSRYNVANEVIFSATFVATFRTRSWPSPAMFVATFKHDF